VIAPSAFLKLLIEVYTVSDSEKRFIARMREKKGLFVHAKVLKRCTFVMRK
jgi:hypothetical protein